LHLPYPLITARDYNRTTPLPARLPQVNVGLRVLPVPLDSQPLLPRAGSAAPSITSRSASEAGSRPRTAITPPNEVVASLGEAQAGPRDSWPSHSGAAGIAAAGAFPSARLLVLAMVSFSIVALIVTSRLESLLTNTVFAWLPDGAIPRSASVPIVTVPARQRDLRASRS